MGIYGILWEDLSAPDPTAPDDTPLS